MRHILKSIKQCLLISLGFEFLFFLLNTYSFYSMADSGKIGNGLLLKGLRSPGLIFDLFYLLLILTVLHFFMSFVWVFSTDPLATKFLKKDKRTGAIILGYLSWLIWLILANKKAFPMKTSSSLGSLGIKAPTIDNFILIVVGGLILLAFVTGVSLRIHDWFRRKPKQLLPISALILVIIFALIWDKLKQTGNQSQTATRSQPDIILIGLDDVRPDHIGYYHHYKNSFTPTLDKLLKKAVVFRNAWTPLARTQPAWISILTGQYPNTHGSIFNLTSTVKIRRQDAMGHILGKKGYYRLYAIDETRFSNIDTAYGFDKQVTPGIGAADFIMGTIADSPVINLMTTFSLSRWLFPFIYMNRGNYTGYDPDTFDERLHETLQSAPPQKPLFLVTHFELPHWPFIWKDHEKFMPHLPPELAGVSPTTYQNAIARTDQQLSVLLEGLRQTGRLQNAIMFIISDHGEAFFESENQWKWMSPEKARKRIILNHQGHGSSVAVQSQYRILFSALAFGPQASHITPKYDLDSTVSLIDIRPTIDEWISIPQTKQPVDGVSLMPLLGQETPTQTWAERAVCLETGFSLPSIELGNPDTRELLKAGSQYYDITPRGRLIITEHWMRHLRNQKQIAALSGQWALAAFPINKEGSEKEFRLLDISTLSVWDALQPSNLPIQAPMDVLKTSLFKHFNVDIDQYQRTPLTTIESTKISTSNS